MAFAGVRTPRASRVLARILDHRKPFDYLWLMALAALPIGVAWWIGALVGPRDSFAGYGERWQWPLYVIMLPLAAYSLRWMANHIGPVLSPELPSPPPPIIGLIKTNAGMEAAYVDLRIALLGPANLFAALLLTFVFHVVDMAQIGGIYLSEATQVCPPTDGASAGDAHCAKLHPPQESLQRLPANERLQQRLSVRFRSWCCDSGADWPVAYLRGGPSKWQNAALVASAYSLQFAVIFMGFLAIILTLRHNLFFLDRVYQRRRVTPGHESSYIHIDIDDEDKCFGFRQANSAFNVQVQSLFIAGIFVVVTRFTNALPREEAQGIPAALFPDVGQWVALLSWFLAMLIVSLPMLVKVLPMLPAGNAEKIPFRLVPFLRQFLSDEEWAYGPDTPRDEMYEVAGQFAENAFWPTGDNRAWLLYFLSFWVFCFALVPNPEFISGWARGPTWLIATLAVEGGVAWILTWALFGFLRTMLTYCDPRLVKPPARISGDDGRSHRRKIPISVFISYRREDLEDITGRLYDSLSNHMDKDKLFLDRDKMRGGADFPEQLRNSIASAQAMLVVIGPKWLTILRSRIQDPNDFVHQEVAQGLQSGIDVFPILVGGATMPSEADLPAALKKLARLHAVEISNPRWDYDVNRLIEDLKSVPRKKQPTAS